MENQKETEEIIDKIESYQIIFDDIINSDSELPMAECGSPEHTSKNIIREGNKIIGLIVKSNDEWTLFDVCCHDCSIKSIFERIDESQTIAIVEGRLEQTPKHIEDISYCLNNPQIWEISTP